MPWIWVGMTCLNLSRVELVRRLDDGVELIMRNGSEVNLTGADADLFLAEWSAYASARVVAREPRPVLTPVLVAPDRPSDLPGQAKR